MAETLRDEPVGVTIGRFQTYALTDAHRLLITKALDHPQTLVLIGNNPISGTKRNPLPASVVAAMIREYAGQGRLNIEALPDFPTDERWSQEVDARIAALFPLQSARIYTGPDGIKKQYSGRHVVENIESVPGARASSLRTGLLTTKQTFSEGFRRGMIYQTQRLLSRPRLAVDIAMTGNVPGVGPAVALIKKNSEPLYRFPGGLVDVTDSSLEAAANRELREELGGEGMEFTKPEYVVSAAISDWRLKYPAEGAQSALFWSRHLHGPIKAGDDAHAAAWFALDEASLRNVIMPEHTHFVHELVRFAHLNPGKTQLRFGGTREN
jgi:ADP-ribose pyrophosphatase YjhB (NUDIX family)